MYTIFSSRFILLICIAEATIPFDPLHTHLLTMEMGDLKASRLGQWSHLGWFKLRQHVTFVLSETPSGTTLPSEYMSELGASPESRLKEGDLSVGSLLGGVHLTSCWESERYRIQAVIQSSEDLNQLWSGAWPLELIQTGAGLPGSWTFTWLLLPTHPLVITSGPLRNRVMWPWTSWLFSARTSPRRAASNCHSHLGSSSVSKWRGTESPIH